jgi:copper(I)-binding protein
MKVTASVNPVVHAGVSVALSAVMAGFVPSIAAAQSAGVIARDAWMREPLPSRDATAVFVVLENSSVEKRTIVSAATTGADTVELHNMVMTGGMMRMTPVPAIEIAPKGRTELKPGSFHIMLFGLKERPKVGSTIPLTLTLDNGQTLPIAAEVRKVEGMQ